MRPPARERLGTPPNSPRERRSPERGLASPLYWRRGVGQGERVDPRERRTTLRGRPWSRRSPRTLRLHPLRRAPSTLIDACGLTCVGSHVWSGVELVELVDSSPPNRVYFASALFGGNAFGSDLRGSNSGRVAAS